MSKIIFRNDQGLEIGGIANATLEEAEAIAAHNRLYRFKADLSTLTRLHVWEAVWDAGDAAVPCVQLDTQRVYTLVTDAAGDGLYFQGQPGRPGEVIFAPRDFSLRRYDLRTPSGRTKAREYVRRKLKKL